jgi:hypothetical protein
MMTTLRPLVLLTALFALGCGGGDTPIYPDTVQVTGTVTQGGKPVDGANVQFAPPRQLGGGANVFAASATTGPDGKYTLSTYFSPSLTSEGALPGQYNVAVTKIPPATATASAHGDAHSESDAPPPQNLLPKQYASPETTPLKATVEPGKPNDIPLELK